MLIFSIHTEANLEGKGFPGDWVVKCPPANAGDEGLVPGSGRSPGEGNGNPLQCSHLENPMDRGAWCAIDHGVTRVGHDLATKPSPLSFSSSIVSDSLRPHGLQHTRFPCPSLSPRGGLIHVHWVDPTISMSWSNHLHVHDAIQPSHPLLAPFSSYPQSFLVLGYFPMSQLFTSGGQTIGLQLQHQPFLWIFRVDFL